MSIYYKCLVLYLALLFSPISEATTICTEAEKSAWMQTNMPTIQANIKYPKVARLRGYKGKVVVSLSINVDGGVSNGKIIQEAHPALNKEAMKVLSLKYTPPICSGEKTATTIKLPINFRLE